LPFRRSTGLPDAPIAYQSLTSVRQTLMDFPHPEQQCRALLKQWPAKLAVHLSFV